MFHAKAIEFYSRCFENLARIDEDMDIEVLIEVLCII